MKRRFMGSKHKDAGYMKVVALEDGLTVSFSNPLEYSFDEIVWQSLPANTQTPAINKDQYVAFRANNLTPNSSSGMGTFSIDKQCDLKGNCMSLLFGDDFSDKIDLTGYNYAFKKLFYSQKTIKSVDPGFLPATTLANYCYYRMFSGCTGLTTTPELPATTLTSSCYEDMFHSCTGLTTAPELPATKLTSSCYSSMFYGCTGLTIAPELPATTLDSSCYEDMFHSCTGLTTAPELPATTLKSYCCNSMFSGCTGLTTAPDLPATTLDYGCYTYMFSGCTGLTTAPKLPATTLADNCYEGMFHNCTGLTTTPELPATTLKSRCYRYMFENCSSLTTAPELPATELATHCYEGMFKGCSSLTTAPSVLPATTLAAYCYQYMFSGCTSLTTAPELPATTLADYCYSSMFYDCTSLTVAPELPATTLAESCYKGMFEGCIGLTTAPELPAATLKYYCYQSMFYNCKNLNYIKALFTTTPRFSYTSNWVYNVSSTGTFVKSKDATWDVTGANGVPNGWTVEIAIDYEFVDLGLPSGTKWSTRNLGASDVNDVGLYYQNGGEQGYKVVLEWNSGSYTIVSSEPDGFNFSTYNISEFKDAANIINKDMSIPSVEDWNELVDNGTFTYDGTNTVYTSNINGNTIIFPRNSVLSNGYSIEYFGLYCSLSFSIHGLNAFYVYDPDCEGATAEDASTSMEIPIQSGMPIRPVKKAG